MMADYKQKSIASTQHLIKVADDLIKKKNFKSALEKYTSALLFAPAFQHDTSTVCNDMESPLITLYRNRSLTSFRLRDFKECIKDIKRAFASGSVRKEDCITLLCRQAWSYWHLKKYGDCSKVVHLTLQLQNGANSKELDVLKSLVTKHNVNSKETETETTLKKDVCDVVGGKSTDILGGSSLLKLNCDPIRGRYLTSNGNIKPGCTIIEEEAYCAVLNDNFSSTRCNYCFKVCTAHGVPCLGCVKALYCNEECRLEAWRKYHWLECSMWPVLKLLDSYSHLALRALLCAAFDVTSHKNLPNSSTSQNEDPCSSIAKHMHHVFNTHHTKAANRKKAKASKKAPVLDGRNSKSAVYLGDYWSVFCLQTHETEHPRTTVVKCGLYANYLAKVLSQCFASFWRKVHRKFTDVNGKVEGDSDAIAHALKSTFLKISLKNLCGENEASEPWNYIEIFRNCTSEVCKNMVSDAPAAKLKPQSCFISKDLPHTFQDVLSFLLRRHMLQLYTNCQAIYDVLPDDNNDDTGISTISQQRIASAIFPTTSLMNHSCDPNTILNFNGRTVKVRAVHSIQAEHEVCHCYGPCISRQSFKERQKMLKEQYFFGCECAVCVKYIAGDSDQQAFMLQFTAYKCLSCSGPMLILESRDGGGVIRGKCANEACKRVCDMKEAYKTYDKLVRISSAASLRMQKEFTAKDLKILEDCLCEMEKILYHNHQAISSLHDAIAYHYGQRKDYKNASLHVTASLKVVSMRYGAKSIEAAREMLKLSSLYFNLMMLVESDKFLKKAEAIFKDTLPPDCEEVLQAKTLSFALNALRLNAMAKKP